MVEIGISKKPSTGEFRVFWKENGKDIEARAYYTDWWQDAVDTLLTIELHNNASGIPTSISSGKSTTSLLRRYNRTFGGMVE